VQLVELSAAAAESFPDWQTPLQALELSTEHRKVLDILQDLPAKQRQVMAWHMDGFSTQEIAAGMDIREDAVRQNLSRARSTLKAKLGLEATGGGEAAK
jgi:RNA polymerase sigma-70 factor (ECF subfamily)